MNILLTTLPTEFETKDYTTREYLLTDYSKYPPLGLLAIAADVDPKHTLKVLDAATTGMTIESTIDYIKNFKPDILGISVVTRRLYALKEISHRIKSALPNTKIVVGGPHVNYWPEETIKLGAMDYILAGYGERSFPQLVNAIESGEQEETLIKIHNLYRIDASGRIISNPPEEIPEILDILPFPKRSLLNLKNYYTAVDKRQMTTMYSSRGCPFHCIFCDVQEKKFHYRTAKSVVDEFEEISKLGIEEIHIFDDTFNVNTERVKDICNFVLQRGLKIKWSSRARVQPFDREMMRLLKQAGCNRLHVGVESLDPETLLYMNKKQTVEKIHDFFDLCKEFHMETLGYFIVGFPTETEEYRRNLLKKVTSLGITYAFCNILYPLPKTMYYQSLLDNGTFQKNYWAEFIRNPEKSYEHPLPRTQQEQRNLEGLVDTFHRNFCFRPGFIFREFKKSLNSPRMFFTKVKLAISLMITAWKPLKTE